MKTPASPESATDPGHRATVGNLFIGGVRKTTIPSGASVDGVKQCPSCGLPMTGRRYAGDRWAVASPGEAGMTTNRGRLGPSSAGDTIILKK
jgi:hypothetical protein